MGKWITQDEIDNIEKLLIQNQTRVNELKAECKKQNKKLKDEPRYHELRKIRFRLLRIQKMKKQGNPVPNTPRTITLFNKQLREMTPQEQAMYQRESGKQNYAKKRGNKYKQHITQGTLYQMFGKSRKELTLEERREYERIMQANRRNRKKECQNGK